MNSWAIPPLRRSRSKPTWVPTTDPTPWPTTVDPTPWMILPIAPVPIFSLTSKLADIVLAANRWTYYLFRQRGKGRIAQLQTILFIHYTCQGRFLCKTDLSYYKYLCKIIWLQYLAVLLCLPVCYTPGITIDKFFWNGVRSSRTSTLSWRQQKSPCNASWLIEKNSHPEALHHDTLVSSSSPTKSADPVAP